VLAKRISRRAVGSMGFNCQILLSQLPFDAWVEGAHPSERDKSMAC